MTILAEIADKMPTVETLWLHAAIGAAVAAVVTLAMSAISGWLGLFPVLLCGVIGVFFISPQGSWDALIVRELGHPYLDQHRASGFLPFAAAVATWIAVARWNRRKKQEDCDSEAMKSGDL